MGDASGRLFAGSSGGDSGDCTIGALNWAGQARGVRLLDIPSSRGWLHGVFPATARRADSVAPAWPLTGGRTSFAELAPWQCPNLLNRPPRKTADLAVAKPISVTKTAAMIAADPLAWIAPYLPVPRRPPPVLVGRAHPTHRDLSALILAGSSITIGMGNDPERRYSTPTYCSNRTPGPRPADASVTWASNSSPSAVLIVSVRVSASPGRYQDLSFQSPGLTVPQQ
jgi:hypothetical protein